MQQLAIFGPAGNADSFAAVSKSSLDAPAWIASLGLGAYEYQCGNGVRISDKTAAQLGANAEAVSVRLSLHSPYYISLSNPEKLEGNIGYILASCKAAAAMGAGRIVVHTGSASGRDRGEAVEDAWVTLRECLRAMDEAGYGRITLCPETMGKINQLGTLEEVAELVSRDERLLPTVDFGHLYARTRGEFQGYEAMTALFDLLENRIGSERTKLLHAHFSHIEYSTGGEKRHTTFADQAWGPDFRPLARLLAERRYTPTIICESSGTQAEDAAEMQRIYLEELEKQ